MPHFEVLKKDGETAARTAIVKTARGHIHTPVFMPVATQGTVKAVTQRDLGEDNEAILGELGYSPDTIAQFKVKKVI